MTLKFSLFFLLIDRLFRKGSFCPVCLKVYRIEEDHINPMVMCDVCDRWVHTGFIT